MSETAALGGRFAIGFTKRLVAPGMIVLDAIPATTLVNVANDLREALSGAPLERFTALRAANFVAGLNQPHHGAGLFLDQLWWVGSDISYRTSCEDSGHGCLSDF